MTRVAVFIDYQNAYMRAREVFVDPKVDPFTFGQVYPRRLGLQLKLKGEEVDPTRTLEEVRVYRGEPDGRQSPVAQAACQRQVRYWKAQARVSVVTRPLRYLPVAWDGRGRPTEWKAREKGIDVLVALDMAMGAVNDADDVAVLVSADTDLVPALEAVMEAGKRVEVASWWPTRATDRGSRSPTGTSGATTCTAPISTGCGTTPTTRSLRPANEPQEAHDMSDWDLDGWSDDETEDPDETTYAQRRLEDCTYGRRLRGAS